MFSLELKFENEAAKERVANYLVEEFDLEVTDGVAPNNSERVGDTIFFTRQPDEEVVPETVETVAEEVFTDAPTAETSETVTDVTTDTVTPDPLTTTPVEDEAPASEILPEVSEENVTEEIEVDINEDTPQTAMEHLEDIRDAVEEEMREIEEGK